MKMCSEARTAIDHDGAASDVDEIVRTCMEVELPDDDTQDTLMPGATAGLLQKPEWVTAAMSASSWITHEVVEIPQRFSSDGKIDQCRRPNNASITSTLRELNRYIAWHDKNKDTLPEQLGARLAQAVVKTYLQPQWRVIVESKYWQIVDAHLATLDQNLRLFTAGGRIVQNAPKQSSNHASPPHGKKLVGLSTSDALMEDNNESPEIRWQQTDMRLGNDILPWLDDDDTRMLRVVCVNGSKIGFVDGRLSNARKIEASTFSGSDGKLDGKFDSAVMRRIEVALRMSAGGLLDRADRLVDRDQNRYPFEIYCPKTQQHNPPRAYFCEVPRSILANDPMANAHLHEIDRVVVLLGAFNKHPKSQLGILEFIRPDRRNSIRLRISRSDTR